MYECFYRRGAGITNVLGWSRTEGWLFGGGKGEMTCRRGRRSAVRISLHFGLVKRRVYLLGVNCCARLRNLQIFFFAFSQVFCDFRYPCVNCINSGLGTGKLTAACHNNSPTAVQLS